MPKNGTMSLEAIDGFSIIILGYSEKFDIGMVFAVIFS